MRAGVSIRITVVVALAVTLLGVTPVTALVGVCAPGEICPMMTSAEEHCRSKVVLEAYDCCAAMDLAVEPAKVPGTSPAHGSVLGQEATAPRSGLSSNSGPTRGGDSPWVRGTPLYTLFHTLLN